MSDERPLIRELIRANGEYEFSVRTLERTRVDLSSSKDARKLFDAAVDAINNAELRRNKAESALINYFREIVTTTGWESECQ